MSNAPAPTAPGRLEFAATLVDITRFITLPAAALSADIDSDARDITALLTDTSVDQTRRWWQARRVAGECLARADLTDLCTHTLRITTETLHQRFPAATVDALAISLDGACHAICATPAGLAPDLRATLLIPWAALTHPDPPTHPADRPENSTEPAQHHPRPAGPEEPGHQAHSADRDTRRSNRA